MVIIYFDCNVFSVIFSVMSLNWVDCQYFHYFLSFFKTIFNREMRALSIPSALKKILFFHYFLAANVGYNFYPCPHYQQHVLQVFSNPFRATVYCDMSNQLLLPQPFKTPSYVTINEIIESTVAFRLAFEKAFEDIADSSWSARQRTRLTAVGAFLIFFSRLRPPTFVFLPSVRLSVLQLRQTMTMRKMRIRICVDKPRSN